MAMPAFGMTAGLCATASSYDATDAASEAPYRTVGHLHALWLKDFAPTSAWPTWKALKCNNASLPLKLLRGSNSRGDINIDLSPVPVPAAVWLFGTAMFGLIGLRRRPRSG